MTPYERQPAIDTQWVDIVQPLPPDPVSIFVWLALLAFLIISFSLIYYIWNKQPRQRALTEIRRCRHANQQGLDTTRSIARRLFHALQLANGNNNFRHAFHTEQAGKNWNDYYPLLLRCVFHSKNPDDETIAYLITETHFWIKNLPQSND